MDRESLTIKFNTLCEYRPDLCLNINIDTYTDDELHSIILDIIHLIQYESQERERKACLYFLLAEIELHGFKIGLTEMAGLTQNVLKDDPSSVQLFMIVDKYEREILEYQKIHCTENL